MIDQASHAASNSVIPSVRQEICHHDEYESKSYSDDGTDQTALGNFRTQGWLTGESEIAENPRAQHEHHHYWYPRYDENRAQGTRNPFTIGSGRDEHYADERTDCRKCYPPVEPWDIGQNGSIPELMATVTRIHLQRLACRRMRKAW